jgi:hypothetical protein
MNNKIIAVTPYDDVLQDGKRLLLVDLTADQMAMISKALGEINEFNRIILYIWNSTDSYDWLLDKKLKSDLIILNADGADQTLVGYLVAQSNSFYFGTLKNISKVSDSSILDYIQLLTIMEKELI